MTRTADLLQEAIEGNAVDDPTVRDLVATAEALRSLSVVCRPDPDFVGALGRRLQAAAAELPARPEAGAVPSRPPTGNRPAARREPKPVVILLGRGLPRLVAAAAVAVLSMGGVVGVAARASLPGQPLYAVKQVLDDAAVRLASSDLDKGRTRLSQGHDHIVEASRLLEGGGTPAGEDVDVALRGAIDDVSRAQRLLQSSFASTRDAQAMLAAQEFAMGAIPLVDALRRQVPAELLPLLAELRELLGSIVTNAVVQLASCQTCGAAGEAARQSLSPAPGEAGSSATGSPPTTSTDGVLVPALPVPGSATPGATLPEATVLTPGATVPVPEVTTTVEVPGVTTTVAVPEVTTTVAVPGATTTVAVPGVTTTVPVPAATTTVTVPGITATVPVPAETTTVTLPAVTATVPVPARTATVTLPAVSATVPAPGIPSLRVSVPSPTVPGS